MHLMPAKDPVYIRKNFKGGVCRDGGRGPHDEHEAFDFHAKIFSKI